MPGFVRQGLEAGTLVLALSLDAFFASLAYGAGEIRLPGKSALVPTGVALELPPFTVGLVYARSGLATKRGLAPANKVGVIDCDYRGELLVALYNQSAEEQTVLPGERIAQLVVTPYIPAEFEETEALSETQRGEGGFGSTGRI